MNKKILLISLLFLLFSVSFVSARMCDADDVLDVLRRALYIYYTNPDESSFEAGDLRDLLTFYVGIQAGQITVDCTKQSDNIDKANALPDTIPSCSDGTKYGKCSANKPMYCYAGRLVPRCRLCGCPTGQWCDITFIYTEKGNKGLWGKCYPGTNVTCSVDNDCGVSSYTGNYYCQNGSESTLHIGDVYRKYHRYECSDPGKENSTCWDWTEGILIDDCQTGETCTEGQAECQTIIQNLTCSDGTQYNTCSITKPKYCDNGTLVDKCQTCGCSIGTCQADGSCTEMIGGPYKVDTCTVGLWHIDENSGGLTREEVTGRWHRAMQNDLLYFRAFYYHHEGYKQYYGKYNGDWISGKFNSGSRHPGNYFWWEIDPAFDLDGELQTTWEAWIKLEEGDNGGTALFYGETNFVEYSLKVIPTQIGMEVMMELPSVFHSVWWDGNLPIGEWVHVMATYDGTQNGLLKIYLNGELKATNVLGKSIPIINDGKYTGYGGFLTIGSGIDNRKFSGQIDEIRISNIVRTLDVENECPLVPQCSDGTLEGRCSTINKPKYCDNKTLILTDSCQICGCDVGICREDGRCITLGCGEEMQVSASLQDMYPDIYEDKIVWSRVEAGTTNPISESYVHDLSINQTIRITDPGGLDVSTPAIYDKTIVYNSFGDIYEYYLGLDGDYGTADDGEETQITDWYPDQSMYPDIYGDKDVWSVVEAGTTNPISESYIYDWVDYETIRISSDSWGNQVRTPAIYGNKLVYSTGDGIYMKDLGPDGRYGTADDGGETQISDSLQDMYPDIYGDKIVWSRVEAGTTNPISESYIHDLSNGKTTRITSDSWGNQVRTPAIYGNKLVYSTGDGIYMKIIC